MVRENYIKKVSRSEGGYHLDLQKISKTLDYRI